MVHAHHMAELWERSRPYYKNFVKSPPREKVCRCLRRIDDNGVIAELELLALKIKFPGLLSGDPDLPYGKNALSPTTRSKPYRLIIKIIIKFAKDTVQQEYRDKLMQFDFGGDE